MHKLVNGVEVELTQNEINELQEEWAQNATLVSNAETNRTILEQLVEIDARSIRALRTSDKVKLLELENQAAALRKQLVK